MPQYTWTFSKQHNHKITNLQELGIHPVLEELLVRREITSKEQALDFFNPRITQVHSPFLMQDMFKACERVISAINEKQKILVYGDYDVDGTTAVACMYLFLHSLDCNVDFYVPDRYTEGYGVSMQGIDHAISENYSLIITLDCGIKAFKTIQKAKSKNIDVIVCDHHEPDVDLPEAYAVLNPKRKDCNYPCKHLSGCGVGFKLIHAICEKYELDLKEYLYSYLDILSISIASDIVPIIDENRVFMYYGLRKMYEKPNIGVQAMLETAQLTNQEISVSDVVFRIGPRINAAGRIYSARKAIELLIASDFESAKELCRNIDEFNKTRREIDKAITVEALDMIKKQMLVENNSTVLYKPEWHKGVIGIVASRLIETHYKPTIVFCGEDDIITGSARSVEGFDVYSALEECSEFMVHFGGHMYAAGMAIRKNDFEAFAEKFENVVSKHITNEQKIQKLQIDCEIDFNDITDGFYAVLKRFGPFGPMNMTPVFVVKNVIDSGFTKFVGEDKSHLRLSITHSSSPHKCINGIGFGLAEKWKQVQEQSKTFDVCFVLQENVFRNTRSLQLEVRDIRISQN